MSTRRDRRGVTLAALAVVLAAMVVVWGVGGVRQAQVARATVEDAAAPVTDRQAPTDYDGDGVRDGADRCPTRPETDNGFQDGDGCPDVVGTTGAS